MLSVRVEMSSVAMSNVPATARAPVVASRFEARMPFWSAAAAAEASYSLVPVVEPEVSTFDRDRADGHGAGAVTA